MGRVQTRAKLFVGGVADVVAANEEAVELSGDRVDAPVKLLRPQVSALAEDAALGVIAGFHELHGLSVGQHFGAPLSEPPQIRFRGIAGAFICPDEVYNGALSVASDGREILLSNGENASR